MTLREVTPPPYEPITLAEAKEWCRITDTSQDTTVLPMLIAAMRRHAEHLTGRAFVQRSLQLVLDGWPIDHTWAVDTGNLIELPMPPVVEVTSITYVDSNGVTQTLAADQYTVLTWNEPALITPAWQVYWPAPRSVAGAIRVNYTAGYPIFGSPADESGYQYYIPDTLKLWMHARLATLYENREQIVVANVIQEIPRALADGLLDELVVGSRLF